MSGQANSWRSYSSRPAELHTNKPRGRAHYNLPSADTKPRNYDAPVYISYEIPRVPCNTGEWYRQSRTTLDNNKGRKPRWHWRTKGVKITPITTGIFYKTLPNSPTDSSKRAISSHTTYRNNEVCGLRCAAQDLSLPFPRYNTDKIYSRTISRPTFIQTPPYAFMSSILTTSPTSPIPHSQHTLHTHTKKINGK